MAWRQGQVKALKVLPSPESCFGSPDNFAHCRPLVVMVDSTGPGSAFTSASFISLKSGEVVHNIKFNSEVKKIFGHIPLKSNDGRDAFLVMSSAYYDRTCLRSAVNFEQKIYFCLSRSSYSCCCARKFT